MNSTACDQPGAPLTLTKNELGRREETETASTVLCLIDCYTIESTGQPLEIYRTAAVEAGTCIQLDELEISIGERLSKDEVAQCIFAICGGDLETADAVGETSRHWVHYSRDKGGLIGLSPKACAEP